VDVASKRAIYDLLASHSGKGMGILVVSSELEEVVGIAHRVLVMSAGKIVKELIGSEITESSVLAASFEGMDTLNGN
jgi:simple sugar transport system ATP-binding protein/ribose transport system ATP-binding protein